jgi:LysR family transcriptional regulator, cys regulon transcriptional activator
LGVVFAPNTIYSKTADGGLRSIDARHLFEPGIVNVGVRRHAFLSKHMIDFIRLYAPHINSAQIQRVLGSY